MARSGTDLHIIKLDTLPISVAYFMKKILMLLTWFVWSSETYTYLNFLPCAIMYTYLCSIL